MSDSVSVFNHLNMDAFTSENFHGVIKKPLNLNQGSKKKQSNQQQRQLLSCTKCRERKVKVRFYRLRQEYCPDSDMG